MAHRKNRPGADSRGGGGRDDGAAWRAVPPSWSHDDDPWLVRYFVRPKDRDRDRAAPGADFLARCPTKVRARLEAIVASVAEAPPLRFVGGGMWEAMHGTMAGFHEARIRYKGTLYRLFCILDRGGATERGVLVIVDGAEKPIGTAMPPGVYDRACGYRTEYERCGGDCLR